MIKKADIQSLVEKSIARTDLFLVGIKVSADNCIEVLVDSPKGVDLDHCTAISRAIESGLDRDVEDFELTVSSAGLDLPFQVLQQYLKYIGKEVEIVFKNGKKLKATLTAADAESLSISYIVLKKEEGAKRKKPITETATYQMNEIKSTKPVINF
ncbi:MAG: ribosome assembly cofactor RimP [Bacteroidales bacterium]|nr:ribosome assembly cofactor RimP [Bacteroidales bacterium]MCL2133364.1 ribosome assembly cofactor RimP [Bacteroidales bacterium]